MRSAVWRLRWSVLVAVLPAACCPTTLVGGRVKRGEDPESRELAGFPFVLTRPEFGITRDEKGIDALGVRWVPDIEHIYTLRLDPSTLADSKFALELNKNGSLKSVSASSTENVTPTLKVVGQLAATAIGLEAAKELREGAPNLLKALEALDTKPEEIQAFVQQDPSKEVKPPLDPFLERLTSMLLQAPPYQFLQVWDDSWSPPVGRAPVAYCACKAPGSWSEDHWREASDEERAALEALLRKLCQPDFGDILSWTHEENLWLRTAQKLVNCEVVLLDRLLAGLKRLPALSGKPLEDELELVWTAAGTLGLGVARAQTQAALEELKTKGLVRKASLESEAKTLKALVAREDDLRRGMIERIEARIQAIQHRDALVGEKTPSNEIADLERQWAVAIGAFEDWVQEQNLLALLHMEARPELAEDSQAEAVRDYDRARLQLATVRRAMTEKRSKFRKPVPALLPNPKDAVVASLTIQRIAQANSELPKNVQEKFEEDPASSQVAGWLQTAAKGKPRFLVVRYKKAQEEDR